MMNLLQASVIVAATSVGWQRGIMGGLGEEERKGVGKYSKWVLVGHSGFFDSTGSRGEAGGKGAQAGLGVGRERGRVDGKGWTAGSAGEDPGKREGHGLS